MDDLPELPFEQILSYLSLQDVIKSRAVSRSWCNRIDSFKVKSLHYTASWWGFTGVEVRERSATGAFAQNLIRSSRFEQFFSTFGPTILSNLKRLCLCAFRFRGKNKMHAVRNLGVKYLKVEDVSASVRILHSFGQLEELALIGFGIYTDLDTTTDLELNLPRLKSIQLRHVSRVGKLTLDAPRLQRVRVECCSELRLDLVHGESVEWLIAGQTHHIAVEHLKNLKFLYSADYSAVDSKFISSLPERLKEFHLNSGHNSRELFKLKQRHGRTDLKIFAFGLLLRGPDDPAITVTSSLCDIFPFLAENPSRVADEIPLCSALAYSTIERVAPGSEFDVLNRLTDLQQIYVERPTVQDNERFLNFQNKFGHLFQYPIEAAPLKDRIHRRITGRVN